MALFLYYDKWGYKMKLEHGLDRLTYHASHLIEACKKTAYDGTVLFTPDGVGNYDALWTRDFGYMVEYCGDLMDPDEIRGCIEYTIARQRGDGWMPDRSELGGDAEYAAGAKGFPVGKANLDNTPFLVFAVYFYMKYISEEERVFSFRRWMNALDRGMACIPVGMNGLVWNDPSDPHSPYGFTDTVCKTGNLFMESVLYWRACRMMGELHTAFGDFCMAENYGAAAGRVETALSLLFDPQIGAFVAADGACRQTDVWGMLYALAVDFPLEEGISAAVEQWLLDNRHRYLYKGQVCQLPDGAPWEKLLIEVPAGEYQNGAYWATASGWALKFLRKVDPAFAERMLEELLADFESDGICECINEGYRKLPQFVVSVTNARGGLL